MVDIYIANDHIIRLSGLRDGSTGQYVETADVEATIIDHMGEEVGGITWPLTLDYVTDSDGIYEGNLEEEFKMSPSGIYTLIVDATNPPDVKGHWEVPARAKIRTS